MVLYSVGVGVCFSPVIKMGRVEKLNDNLSNQWIYTHLDGGVGGGGAKVLTDVSYRTLNRAEYI